MRKTAGMQYNIHAVRNPFNSESSKKKIPTGGVGICKEGVMK